MAVEQKDTQIKKQLQYKGETQAGKSQHYNNKNNERTSKKSRIKQGETL